MKFATNSEINAITEIIHNIPKGVIPCVKNKKKLRKHANYLRFIGDK